MRCDPRCFHVTLVSLADRGVPFAIGFILAIFFGSCAWSQGVTGVISGTVTDPRDAIGGATVTITNADTGIVAWTGKTNLDGVYRAPDLPAARYNVDVTAAGFRRQRVFGIELSVDPRADIPVPMQVGEVAETVTVDGGRRASWRPTARRSGTPSHRLNWRICLCPAAMSSISLR